MASLSEKTLAEKPYKSMKQFESMTDEELIQYYRNGYKDAVEVLIQRYKQFVRAKIKSNYFVGIDKEDLIQEGMIGLFKAICDYNMTMNTSFKSFANICVVRQISTAFKTVTRQKHIPLNTSISLNIPINNKGEEGEDITLMDTIKSTPSSNPEEVILDQESLKGLNEQIKKSLSKMEWQVLNLHTQGKNYHEIADELQKPVKCIDNALQRIKRKLSRVYIYQKKV